MQKMSTLFEKDPNNLSRVIDKVAPENMWVFEDEGVQATRKFDGTSCAIIGGKLYKRYMVRCHKDVRNCRPIPDGAIPCSDLGVVEIETGWSHWIPCDRDNPADKYHWEGYDNLLKPHFPVGQSVQESIDTEDSLMKSGKFDGSYELCGPKVQNNPEGLEEHILIRHGVVGWPHYNDRTFEDFKNFLEEMNIEGIVFHHPDNEPNDPNNRYCKLRKTDFGLKR